MTAQASEWVGTILSVLVGVFGTLGGSAWLRRRMGKESVLMKAATSAGRTAVAEVVAPEMSARMDTQGAGIVALTGAVSSLADDVWPR
jgi:hypothetical protein